MSTFLPSTGGGSAASTWSGEIGGGVFGGGVEGVELGGGGFDGVGTKSTVAWIRSWVWLGIPPLPLSNVLVEPSARLGS